MPKRPSITTKTGDEGMTSLYSGERVFKNDPRPDAYGTVDELETLLGIARLLCHKEENKENILFLQRSLFAVNSEIATTPEKRARLKTRAGEHANVEMHCVASIPREPNGKFRAVISKVQRTPLASAPGGSPR